MLFSLHMSFPKFSRPLAFGLIFHVLGWFLFFSLIIAFTYNSPGGENVMQEIFSPPYLLFYVTYLAIFYFNANLLMPRLYLQKKHLLYFALLVLLFIAVYFLSPFDHLIRHNNLFPQGPGSLPPNPMRPMGKGGPRFDIVSLMLFAMIWSLSAALSIIKEWRNTLQRVSRAEADKVKAELAFLKAQINPHFLFNTLNNIYSLAVTKNENTSFAIMKLSNIMRYVTDDATRDFVALQSEVDCISDYIDLQRLRLNKKTEINFSIGGNLGDKQIAPLILITFVENVFKYGISNHEPSAVIIKIVAGERQIELFCQNKIFSGLRRIERTGIGIKNTEQRLKFLYPGKHSLNITIENSHYNVLLTIEI